MREHRRCGFHRLTCAWRVAIGALAVCSVHAASSTDELGAQAPSTGQEVGMAHWGSTYVWLRVTETGLVEVYASTGYRNAFVQPVALTASDVDRWASSLDQLAEPTDAHPASMTSDGTLRGTDDDGHVVLGGGDLVLEVVPALGSEPKLRVWVGATRPDAVVALVVPEAAPDGALMLREAARRARNVAGATLGASAPSTPASTATEIEPAAPQTTSITVAAATPPVAASARPMESTDAPMSVVEQPSVPTPVLPAGGESATPLASASTSTPLVSTRTTTTVASLKAPGAHVVPVHGSHDSALPVLRTTTTTKPLHVAASGLANVRTVNDAPENESVRQHSSTAARSASHTSRSTATSAPTDEARGVDDATVQNLVGQWRPDLMYCYTQYGLREHTALTGALVVRFALSPDGSVGHSLIGSRKWSGDGGAEVESCIRSRVAAWRFPPARAGSIHTFSLEFAPGRS
jgi:hypothetical protein